LFGSSVYATDTITPAEYRHNAKLTQYRHWAFR
jgi:hypothetical protein